MNGPITEKASVHSDNVQVTVQTNPAGRRSRLMAPLILQRKAFRGSRVQATRLPRLLRRAVAQAFGTYGQIGLVAEQFRTRLLPLLTRLHSEFNTNIFLTMSHNTGGTVTPVSGWKPAEHLFSITATPATVQLHQLDWQGPALTPGTTIRLQLQWAAPSRRWLPLLILI